MTLYSRLLNYVFRMRTQTPEGVTPLKLDVDLCSIVPDSSLVPCGRACLLYKASLSHLLILSVLRPNLLLLYDVMLITSM